MRKTTAPLIVILVAVASLRSVRAQSPSPTTEPRFEVASVKPSPPGMTYQLQYGRNTIAIGPWRLSTFIGLAFADSGRVGGGTAGLPDWGNTEFYTVDAKAEDGVLLTPEALRPRLRQLLVERFKLATHDETAYAGGFALVLAKGGPKLKETTEPLKMTLLGGASMRAPSATMDSFAGALRAVVGQPVTNETGLPGNYEFSLTYAPEGAVDSALPSIFTALEEQLGLKLVGGRKVPVTRLVIDHVEHLIED